MTIYVSGIIKVSLKISTDLFPYTIGKVTKFGEP
jgi:hypothetical protein